MWWNDIKCKYMFLILLKNLARKGLIDLLGPLAIKSSNKMIRERQHPWPAEITKCKHWPTVAISNSDPLHGTLHHANKFLSCKVISSNFVI